MRLAEIINEGDDNIKGRFYSALKGNQPVILAYGEGSGRNLDIIGQPVSLDEWAKVMNFALSDTMGSYNDFEVDSVYRELKDLLYALSIGEDELRFVPGREGSVVLYIQGPEEYLKELADEIDHHKSVFHANEIDVYPAGRKSLSGPTSVSGPVLRLWWD